MNLERQLRSANRVLARYIPTPSDPTAPIVAPSHPYLQWCFSEPNIFDHICPPCWFIAPVFDLDGNMQYDYHCACGINKIPRPTDEEIASIRLEFLHEGYSLEDVNELAPKINDPRYHSAFCNSLTIPKVRMAPAKTGPTLENVWVLCRWVAPRPLSTWIELYGTADNYPTNGRYIPMSENGVTVTLPKEHPPLPGTSEDIIRRFKAHDAEHKLIEEESDAKRDKRDWTQPHYVTKSGTLRPDTWERPPVGSKFDQYRDHFKDKMMEFGQIPGKKQHVSFGGTTPTLADTKSSIDIVVVKD